MIYLLECFTKSQEAKSEQAFFSLPIFTAGERGISEDQIAQLNLFGSSGNLANFLPMKSLILCVFKTGSLVS